MAVRFNRQWPDPAHRARQRQGRRGASKAGIALPVDMTGLFSAYVK
jgi:hypothetical protein